MTSNHYKIKLKEIKLSLNDLITIEHQSGSIEYVPVFIMDLMTEKLKALMSKKIPAKNLQHSIDFAEYDINDLLTP